MTKEIMETGALFESMAYREKTMAVKEIAEALGVSSESIKWHVRKMYPEILKNGVETRLTELQVTEIKEKMIPTSKLVGAVTGIERQETILRAFQYLKEDFEAMKQRVETAETKLIEQASKVEFYDIVADSKDTHTMQEVAAYLNKKGLGRNHLYDVLRRNKILMKNNIPYRQYIEVGYFRVIEKEYIDNNGYVHINPVTLVFQKGLEFIINIIQRGIE